MSTIDISFLHWTQLFRAAHCSGYLPFQVEGNGIVVDTTWTLVSANILNDYYTNTTVIYPFLVEEKVVAFLVLDK